MVKGMDLEARLPGFKSQVGLSQAEKFGACSLKSGGLSSLTCHMRMRVGGTPSGSYRN